MKNQAGFIIIIIFFNQAGFIIIILLRPWKSQIGNKKIEWWMGFEVID